MINASDNCYMNPRYPNASSLAATATMKANKRVDTGPEVALRSILHRNGFRFRKDYPLNMNGQRCRPDIVFPRRRIAIFVDGCFWHRCPEHFVAPRKNNAYWSSKMERNVKRDLRNNEVLIADGWNVVRVWEHVGTEDALEFIKEVMQSAANRPCRLSVV